MKLYSSIPMILNLYACMYLYTTTMQKFSLNFCLCYTSCLLHYADGVQKAETI